MQNHNAFIGIYWKPKNWKLIYWICQKYWNWFRSIFLFLIVYSHRVSATQRYEVSQMPQILNRTVSSIRNSSSAVFFSLIFSFCVSFSKDNTSPLKSGERVRNEEENEMKETISMRNRNGDAHFKYNCASPSNSRFPHSHCSRRRRCDFFLFSSFLHRKNMRKFNESKLIYGTEMHIDELISSLHWTHPSACAHAVHCKRTHTKSDELAINFTAEPQR